MAGVLDAVVATAGDLHPAPGVTGTVAVVVAGGPDGDRRARVRLVDGRPVEASEDGGPAKRDDGDADLTLSLPMADARAVAAGRLEPSVAFMRGRLKTAGDNRLLLGLLAATADPGFPGWLAGVAAAPPGGP